MLTLQFIPYSSISGLESEKRVDTLLDIVKQDKIVLLEGRLAEKEEADLIRRTMDAIPKKLTGIVLGVVHTEQDSSFQKKIKKMLVRLLIGTRDGFTIIGPANVVKEIKKDPDKIQLFTKELPAKKQKKK